MSSPSETQAGQIMQQERPTRSSVEEYDIERTRRIRRHRGWSMADKYLCASFKVCKTHLQDFESVLDWKYAWVYRKNITDHSVYFDQESRSYCCIDHGGEERSLNILYAVNGRYCIALNYDTYWLGLRIAHLGMNRMLPIASPSGQSPGISDALEHLGLIWFC